MLKTEVFVTWHCVISWVVPDVSEGGRFIYQKIWLVSKHCCENLLSHNNWYSDGSVYKNCSFLVYDAVYSGKNVTTFQRSQKIHQRHFRFYKKKIFWASREIVGVRVALSKVTQYWLANFISASFSFTDEKSCCSPTVERREFVLWSAVEVSTSYTWRHDLYMCSDMYTNIRVSAKLYSRLVTHRNVCNTFFLVCPF